MLNVKPWMFSSQHLSLTIPWFGLPRIPNCICYHFLFIFSYLNGKSYCRLIDLYEFCILLCNFPLVPPPRMFVNLNLNRFLFVVADFNLNCFFGKTAGEQTAAAAL